MRLLNKISLYMTRLGVFVCALLLMSCSSVEVTDYQESTPTLSLAQFFDGKLTAAGIVQDFSGKVIRKFNVTMEASWQGNQGTIKEWFIYDDGETQTRIWVIDDKGDGNYEGRAGDILGVAQGQASGSALRWKYDMMLAIDGDEYQVHFDDWMFLVNDTTIINHSDIIKFGITVAKVTLVIQKV